MKKKIIIGLSIIGLVSFFFMIPKSSKAIDVNPSPTPATEETTSKPIVSKIIVIDPGHGPLVNDDVEPVAPNSDVMKRKYGMGAVGNYTGTLEREINLDVSLQLEALLIEKGYNVIMTRLDQTTILSNIDRVNIANDANADLMIRIHSDSSVDTSVEGASVLVPGAVGYAIPIMDISRDYAEIVLTTLLDEVGMKQHGEGVFERTDQTGFNWSKVPIFTLEMGFLSNENEDHLLSTKEYRTTLAQAIAKGIDACFQ